MPSSALSTNYTESFQPFNLLCTTIVDFIETDHYLTTNAVETQWD